MKRYWNIYERIYSMDNLRLAHHNARKDKALYKEVQMVNKNEDYFLKKIQKILKERKYHISPKDYSVSTIRDKTKSRELWKLKYYPHRIIQRAIMLQLEEIFTKNFTNFTCASVKNRWMSQVMKLMSKYLWDKEWTKYCLKLDITKYYPSVNHRILKKILRRKFKDKDLLNLLDMLIDSFPWKRWLPIGSYLSQFLANFYLSYFDHRMKEKLHIKYVVRYMDDIVILCWSKKKLWYYYRRIKWYLEWSLNLSIKWNYQIFPTDKRWIDFVWYRYFHGYTLLRKRVLLKMKDKIKKLWIKINKWIMMNFRDWCSINSYTWWIIYCNHHRLYNKYIYNLTGHLSKYYYCIICNNKRRTIRYYKNLISKQY